MVTWVTRLGDAVQHVRRARPDVMLMDLSLPDARGLETCSRARAAAPGVPLVVLTGLEDERMAIAAVQEGAQDYLTKGRIDPETLSRTIRYAIERAGVLARLGELQREQLRVRDELLSHVSHELGTPVAVIRQYATILLDGIVGPLNERQQEAAAAVVRNSEQLGAMVKDLVDSARTQSGKVAVSPRPVDLGDLVDEAVSSFRPAADGKGIKLAAQVAPGQPPALADPPRVGQVLANLIGNAVKFTPRGGFVRVSLAEAEEPLFLAVAVVDSGPGMDAEDVNRVFERLYQAESSGESIKKGLGLGLYIARDLVARHGGRLWADSRPGKGSTFTFTLPVANGDTARADDSVAP